jgi:ABC-type transport system substrate-binding protein
MSTIPFPVSAPADRVNGPRINELLIKIYDSDLAEFAAFEACSIDLLDWPLTSNEINKWTKAPYNETIVLDPFREIGGFEFDINNNKSMLSYPESTKGISPTYYKEVRHAIAHLVDKPYILTAIVGGYGAICEMAYIMPWLRWYDPTMPTHSYDPAEACRILYEAGWRGSNDPNLDPTDPYAKMKYPTGHLKEGQYVEDVLTRAADHGLIFYRRSDHSLRRDAGGLLIYGDATHKGMEDIGIPVEDLNVPRTDCSPNVMYKKNFHIYTGGWSFGRDPDGLYDLYHSRYMEWDITLFAWNYNNINDALWDSYLEGVKYPKTIEDAETAAHAACQRFGEMVFFVPLWTTLGYMAHKKPWHVLNVDSYGVRNWWNIYCINNPEIGPVGGQLKWGFKADVEALNVIFSQWVWDWQVLDKLYDSLLGMNPLNIAVDMPWMASDWSVGTWTNPDTGKMCSKITFNLKSGIHFVDTLTGAELGEVTPEDVRFSFQYVYDKVGWNYPSVADIYKNGTTNKLKIEISGNTIIFYESVLSTWALHWTGGLPIIPKFIFESIPDPTGFTPGNLPKEDVLVGSGAFYYVSYLAGVSCVLRAVGYPDPPETATYFMTIAPNTDTQPEFIKLDWGIFRANCKAMDWTVNVLDMIIVASALEWTGPVGDIPADVRKDGEVNVLDLIVISTNLEAGWY